MNKAHHLFIIIVIVFSSLKAKCDLTNFHVQLFFFSSSSAFLLSPEQVNIIQLLLSSTLKLNIIFNEFFSVICLTIIMILLLLECHLISRDNRNDEKGKFME